MPRESEVMNMTFIEELLSLIVRTQNLRARIECAEDPDMALEERTELEWLLVRLDKMKGGRGSRLTRIKAAIEVNLQKGEYPCFM